LWRFRGIAARAPPAAAESEGVGKRGDATRQRQWLERKQTCVSLATYSTYEKLSSSRHFTIVAPVIAINADAVTSNGVAKLGLLTCVSAPNTAAPHYSKPKAELTTAVI